VLLPAQALGMKLVVRTNNMGRMKAVFTAEIFTESTVAAHAVKEYYQQQQQQQLFLLFVVSLNNNNNNNNNNNCFFCSLFIFLLDFHEGLFLKNREKPAALCSLKILYYFALFFGGGGGIRLSRIRIWINYTGHWHPQFSIFFIEITKSEYKACSLTFLMSALHLLAASEHYQL
jgi:hypothetical protein